MQTNMQPTPSASYGLTLRLKVSSRAGSLGELTMAIGRAGGDIGAIDATKRHKEHKIIKATKKQKEHKSF